MSRIFLFVIVMMTSLISPAWADHKCSDLFTKEIVKRVRQKINLKAPVKKIAVEYDFQVAAKEEYAKQIKLSAERQASLNSEKVIQSNRRFKLAAKLYSSFVSLSNGFSQKVPWPFLKDATYQAAMIITHPHHFIDQVTVVADARAKVHKDYNEFSSMAKTISRSSRTERLRQARVRTIKYALSNPEVQQALSEGQVVRLWLPKLKQKVDLKEEMEDLKDGKLDLVLNKDSVDVNSVWALRNLYLKELGGISRKSIKRLISQRYEIQFYLKKLLVRQALLRWRLNMYQEYMTQADIDGRLKSEDVALLKNITSALGSPELRSSRSSLRVSFIKVLLEQFKYRFNKDIDMSPLAKTLSDAINGSGAFVEESINVSVKNTNFLFKHMGKNIGMYILLATGSTTTLHQYNPTYMPDVADYVLYQKNPSSISNIAKEEPFWRDLGRFIFSKHDLNLLAGRLNIGQTHVAEKINDLLGATEDLKRAFQKRSDFYKYIPDKVKEFKKYSELGKQAYQIHQRVVLVDILRQTSKAEKINKLSDLLEEKFDTELSAESLSLIMTQLEKGQVVSEDLRNLNLSDNVREKVIELLTLGKKLQAGLNAPPQVSVDNKLSPAEVQMDNLNRLYIELIYDGLDFRL